MVEISIIVPVYNVEKWIDKCLQSIENQTFKEYEVIIINDGTEDNSDKIADSYCSKYDNWKMINTKNQGLSIARNEGLKYVKGKYVYFLDSDDYIENDCLELLYNLAEKYQHDITIANMRLFSEELELDGDTTIGCNIVRDSYPENIENFTLESFPQIVWLGMITNKLYRKDLLFDNIILFPNEYIIFEDMVFDYQTLVNAKSIGMVDKQTYNYLIKQKFTKDDSIQWNYFNDENTQIKRIIKKLKSKTLKSSISLYYKWLVVDLLSYLIDYDKNSIDYDYIFDEYDKFINEIPYQILDKKVVKVWDKIKVKDIDGMYKEIANIYDNGYIEYNENIREMIKNEKDIIV